MRMIAIACALTLAVSTAARAQMTWEKPGRTIVGATATNAPLIDMGGYPAVDVVVNGRPLRFGLETGGAVIAISTRAATALGVTIEAAQPGAGPGPQSLAWLDSIRIGGVKFERIRVAVTASIEPRGFDGIVTPALLRDVMYTIDLRNRNLRLERGALPPVNGQTILTIPRADRGGRIDIPVQVGGMTIPAVLDTQASFELIVSDSLESRFGFATAPASIGQAYGPSQGTFTMRGARTRDAVRVGSSELLDLPVVLRNRPGPVVGLLFMEQFIITVDDANGRVRLAPHASPIRFTVASWERARTGGSVASGGFMLGLRTDQSRTVQSVAPGSNIDRAGIREGDVFEEIEGKKVASLTPADWQTILASGNPVSVTLLRAGTPYTTKIALVPRAADAGPGGQTERQSRPQAGPPAAATPPAAAQPAAAQPAPPAAAATGDLRSEIERLNAAMVTAFRSGDALAVAAFYSDDARILSARGSAVEGREAINRYWQSMPRTATWNLEVKDVGGTRDLVYQFGRSTLQNGQMMSAVDWVGIWKRQPDGQLKLAIDYYVAAPRQ